MTMSKRYCPTDGTELTARQMAGETVDQCDVCSGIFFDDKELERTMELVSLFENVSLDEEDIPSVPCAEIKRAVSCPADGSAMQPTELGGTIVDVCPTCGGYWLDGGELTALRLVQANIEENLNLYMRLGS